MDPRMREDDGKCEDDGARVFIPVIPEEAGIHPRLPAPDNPRMTASPAPLDFARLPLTPAALANLQLLGYTQMTPIRRPVCRLHCWAKT